MNTQNGLLVSGGVCKVTDGDLRDRFLSEFKSRCCGKLEDLGDTSTEARQYDEAISHYSVGLSLNPTTPQALFIKRSKARAKRGLWEDALSDANEVWRFCRYQSVPCL